MLKRLKQERVYKGFRSSAGWVGSNPWGQGTSETRNRTSFWGPELGRGVTGRETWEGEERGTGSFASSPER